MITKEAPDAPSGWRFQLRHLVILAILSPLILAFVYFSAINSDAFDAAENFVRSSSEVSKRIGQVNAVKLSFWDGFEVAGSGGGGNAEFIVIVAGDRGEAVVDIRLQHRATQWIIQDAYVKTDSGPMKLPVGSKQ